MSIKQISVFVANRPGRLSSITELLSSNNIDIRAFSIADTKDFGILRLIVDKPDMACEVLKGADCTVSLTNVVAIGVADKPGGLTEALKCLYAANISVEYMYAFVAKGDASAYVILRVGNSETATDALSEAGFKILEGKDIYEM